MFQDLSFCCTKKVPKNHNQLFHFRHRSGSTLLVLAQTLMYGIGILGIVTLFIQSIVRNLEDEKKPLVEAFTDVNLD